MATKSMAYDHPDYQVVRVGNFACAAGANAVSVNKFIAHTDVILKGYGAAVVTAGTSADGGNGITFKTIKGQGTATTSVGAVALGTLTAAQYLDGTFADVALAKGEQVTLTNGTDATGAALAWIEYVVKPGASVSQ